MVMDDEKAPSPNGFTMAFFKHCWDVVKNDLLRVFIEFHKMETINKSMNSTFSTLMPKKDGLLALSDFRPINLIASIY